jgi:hypothetical protein
MRGKQVIISTHNLYSKKVYIIIFISYFILYYVHMTTRHYILLLGIYKYVSYIKVDPYWIDFNLQFILILFFFYI